jgi:hypothetical protein
VFQVLLAGGKSAAINNTSQSGAVMTVGDTCINPQAQGLSECMLNGDFGVGLDRLRWTRQGQDRRQIKQLG